ncbi:MAG: hypothetical protein HZC16_02115 [Candidatus Omnitrophica bacterium]|nr:hypothetical protein [Candidatus Omnitrophota bacterium]
MRKTLALIIICVFLGGCCSLPRKAIYEQIYSYTSEKKKIKARYGGSRKIEVVQDFRERQAYEEDITAFKEKIEKYIAEQPNLSENAKERLRQMRVSAGATKEEVSFLLGPPEKIERINKADNQQIWIYRTSKISFYTIAFLPVFFVREGYYLYFKDNLLTLIERHYLEQTFYASDSDMGLYGKNKNK